jgi:hypothetical protein
MHFVNTLQKSTLKKPLETLFLNKKNSHTVKAHSKHREAPENSSINRNGIQ